MKQGTRARWSRWLQVERPDDWRCWLLRLFVLPGAQAGPAAQVPAQAPVLGATTEPPPHHGASESRPAGLGPTAAPPNLPPNLPPRGGAPIRRQAVGAPSGWAALDLPDATRPGGAAAAVPARPAPAPEPEAGLEAAPRKPVDRSPDGASLLRTLGRAYAVGTQALWRALRVERWAPVFDRFIDLTVRRSRLLRGLMFGVGAVCFWLAATTPLEPLPQALFFLAMLGAAVVVRHVPGQLPTLMLIALALLASMRYGWWRLTESVPFEPSWDGVFGIGLLLAELYAWLVMLLGFVQTVSPLRRPVEPIDLPRARWPTVDVFIPTYNEPLSVVGPTVLAARDLDWPAGRLRVYLLDDGRRPEMRAFAEKAGVTYLSRPDNLHAKAGNLNHALAHSGGQFVAMFDCDHMPMRSFLVRTMGWLLRDPGCALVQTPHHFFSPDPFERNLDTFRRIPSEGELFYGLVQDGNDAWNACYFCGSCAVLRRAALDDIGGVATETVTEDAHTALRLHRRGWRSAYLNETLASGLAVESLAGHVRQRMRWARGMAQIFRIDNPLLGRGLSLMQRLCYANAMLHFFYGLPRLVFLTAPLAYLYFGLHIIQAQVGILVLYLLPHLVLPAIANAHTAGPHRHSFWSELYETVLAWYVALPTTLALLDPRRGRFEVTAKGDVIEQTHLDWRIARPYLVLIALNAFGLLAGLALFVLRPADWGTTLLNTTWTLYNLLALGAALGVARERRQVRRSTRVAARLPVHLLLGDGRQFECETDDYALTGLALAGVPEGLPLAAGEWAAVRLFDAGHPKLFPVRLVARRGDRLGLRFERLSIDQTAALIRCTFTRPGAWKHWQQEPETDRALHGLIELARFGVQSYATLARSGIGLLRQRARQLKRRWPRPFGATAAGATAVGAAGAGAAAAVAGAQSAVASRPRTMA